SGSTIFQVSVADPAVIATALNFSAGVNVPFTSQAVATFTDPGGAEPNPSDPTGTIANHYSATIDWGDFSGPTPATITYSGSPGSTTGVFTVSGSHTYSQIFTYTTTITITHEGAPQTVVQGTVNVSTQALVVTPPGNQTSAEGTLTSFSLGSFSDSNS